MKEKAKQKSQENQSLKAQIESYTSQIVKKWRTIIAFTKRSRKSSKYCRRKY